MREASTAMSYKHYKAPPQDLADFYLETLPRLMEHEEHEGIDLCKRLVDIFDGPKNRFSLSTILDYLPWLAQAGVIEPKHSIRPRRGGFTVLVRRSDNIIRIKNVLRAPEDIETDGKASDTVPTIDKPAKGSKKKGKKKAKKKSESKKKCCDDPKIVRSKKTGKRRCKNCGAKLRPKDSS